MLRLTKVFPWWPRLTLLPVVISGALGLWIFLQTPIPEGAGAYIGADQPEIREKVGRAGMTTSLALALGFLGMLASKFQTLADTGWLSAAAIGAARVTDLILPSAPLAVASRNRVQARVPACTG